MTAFGPRAGGLRLIRILLIAMAFGTIFNTTGGVYLFLRNSQGVGRINAERARNTVAACNRESGQNRAIVGFLRERHASPDTLADAVKYFPVRSPAECASQARRQVSSP